MNNASRNKPLVRDQIPTQDSVAGHDQFVLNAQSICAGYRDRPVLHDISVSVREGERVLLIGPNGCGKTTFLKVVAGVLKPDSGTVLISGCNMTAIPASQRITQGMGYLMQTRNIFTSLTVEENLHLGFWNGNGNFSNRRDWVVGIFPMLKERLDSRSGLLSGGERQALAISMVLMRPVSLLLLDEPTAGLSPSASTSILAALHQAQEELGFTSILVEHNLRQVKPWITRVVAMNQGRIVADHDDPEVLADKDQLHRYYF